MEFSYVGSKLHVDIEITLVHPEYPDVVNYEFFDYEQDSDGVLWCDGMEYGYRSFEDLMKSIAHLVVNPYCNVKINTYTEEVYSN